jgi:mannose-6-phosphate isomerase-like protein (cupin superfamily)
LEGRIGKLKSRVIHLGDCEEFVAGDHSILHEILHPDKAPVAIRYSLAHAEVAPGRKTRAHRLKTAEVYYILAGGGRMHIDDESAEVDAGCAVYIPPGSTQYIENTGHDDLRFLCIVDPAWREADEEIIGKE